METAFLGEGTQKDQEIQEIILKKNSQHSEAAQAVLHEFKAILVYRKNSY